MSGGIMRRHDPTARYLVRADAGGALADGKRGTASEMPDDWAFSTIGREFEIQLGKMLDAARNTGVLKPYIGNRSVQWGRFDLAELSEVPLTTMDRHRFRLRTNDLLVCEGGEVGRAAIWNDPIPECYYQKALHRLRPRGAYDVRLMMGFLQFWASTGYLTNFVTQTSIAHLPKEKLEAVPLPVPTIEEQRAIAETLSDVDGLLGALEALMAKKRAIKQAVVQQLLTGKTRLPGFSGEWKTKRLGECLVSRPRYGINAAAVPFSDNLPSYIRITDISEDGIFRPAPRVSVTEARAKDYFLRGGDVVFARTGGSVGKSYLYRRSDGELVFAGFLICVRPDPEVLVPAFLAAYAMTSAYWTWVRLTSMRSGQPGINGAEYEQLPLTLPALPEQTAIAIVLSDMDAEIAALEGRRDKTRAIKQGMMQQLLTGRVRLVAPTRPPTTVPR